MKQVFKTVGLLVGAIALFILGGMLLTGAGYLMTMASTIAVLAGVGVYICSGLSFIGGVVLMAKMFGSLAKVFLGTMLVAALATSICWWRL